MRKGFTLVELLTVITIIAVLAGLLLPVLHYVRQAFAVKEATLTVDQLAAGLQTMKDHYRYDGLLGKDEDGHTVPITIDWELDPYNRDLGWEGEVDPPSWRDGWEPHLNMRADARNPARKLCKRFYETKRRRIADHRLVDPWGSPYTYDIVTRSQDMDGDGEAEEVEVERVLSRGPDCLADTGDDVVAEVGRETRREDKSRERRMACAGDSR